MSPQALSILARIHSVVAHIEAMKAANIASQHMGKFLKYRENEFDAATEDLSNLAEEARNL